MARVRIGFPGDFRAGGGGAGGLSLRRPPDIFDAADLAACRTARDTFFTMAGNSDILAQYQNNSQLAIVLRPTGGDDVFETYLPGNVGAYDNANWVERTDAVQGPQGTKGDPGARGPAQTDANIDARIATYARIAPTGEIPDAQIPAGIARDSELPDVSGFLTESEVDNRIAGYARATPTGQIADAQIPDAIMRDAEFTLAAVRNLLSLSAQEVDDLLTGGSISGSVLTLTQNDGSTITLNLPTGGQAVADGVVDGGSISADGMTLRLTRTEGDDIEIDIPALLRNAGVSEARVNELIAAANLASEADLLALAARVTALEGHVDTSDHIRYFGWSADRVIETADFAGANQAMSNDGTLPAHNTNDYIWFAVPESEGAPSALHLAGGQIDQLGNFDQLADTVNDEMGTAHIVFVSQREQLHVAYSGAAISLIY